MGDRADVLIRVKPEHDEKVKQLLIENELSVWQDQGFASNGFIEFNLEEVNYAGSLDHYKFLFDEKIPVLIHYGQGCEYASGNIVGNFDANGEYLVKELDDTDYGKLPISHVISMVENMGSKEELLDKLKSIQYEHDCFFNFNN